MNKTLFCAISVIILLIALLLTVACYRHGPGLHSDTAAYFKPAWTTSLNDLPTYHAPVYSVCIYVGGVMGLAPRTSAMIINCIAVLLSLVIVLVGFRHYSEGVSLAFAGLLAISYPFVYNNAWAMSEALFYPSILAFAWSMFRYCDAPSRIHALLAGLLASAASLTRFAGIAFFVSGILLVLIHRRSAMHIRLRDIIAYTIAFVIPFGLYYVWNSQRSGSGLHRAFGINPVTVETYNNGITTISEWVMPYKLFAILGIAPVGIAIVIGFSTLALSVFRDLHKGRYHAYVPGVCAIVYLLFVNTSIWFSDMQTPLDHRILSPLYIMLLIYLVDIISRSQIRCPLLFPVLLVYLFLLNGVRDASFVRNVRAQGLGYASVKWQHNELMEYVMHNVKQRTIYSNAPEAIRMLTGVDSVRWIPFRKNMYTREANEGFYSQMVMVAEDVMSSNAAIVIFRAKHRSDDETPDYLPTVLELQELTGATTTRDDEIGVIIEKNANNQIQRTGGPLGGPPAADL